MTQQAETVTLTKSEFTALICAAFALAADTVGPFGPVVVQAGNALVDQLSEMLGVEGCGDHEALVEVLGATGWWPEDSEEATEEGAEAIPAEAG